MHTNPVEEARPSLAARNQLRHDWENAEVEAIYHTSLRELVFRVHSVHRADGAQTLVCATTAERGQTRRLISIMAASA